MAKKSAQAQAPRFEDALKELETVVKELEGGELGLDDSLARYERGVGLLTQCRNLLNVAEHQVALLTGVDEQGQPVTQAFDGSATFERDSKPKSAAEPKPAEPEPEAARPQGPDTIEPPFDPT